MGVSHSWRPVVRSSATTRGLPTSATGTNTLPASTATDPLTGALTSCAHAGLPVAASRAYTSPLLDPAMTLPSATAGVPVKSPSCDQKLQTTPRLGRSLAAGP